MKDLSFVTTLTPLRISLLGGGTDIEYYYKKYEGCTFSVAINKYVAVTVKKHTSFFPEKYRLNYSQSESCQNINEISNRIVKETLKMLNIKDSLYISVISDAPTGSGLGGSSSFVVGLILALCKLKKIKITKKKLFELSTKLEINILKEPIGLQDHVPAVFGGANYTIYKKDGKIKLFNYEKIREKLNKYLNLYWTGNTRSASEILTDQKKNFHHNIESLNMIKKNCMIFKDKLNKNMFDIKLLSALVNLSWIEKKKLSNKIDGDESSKIIELALKQNSGTKLLGAGGGGFVLVLERKEKLKKINKFYTKKITNLIVDPIGSRVISLY